MAEKELWELTTEDHLNAYGFDPNSPKDAWIYVLAEMLVEFTDNDVAIASARAVDLSSPNTRYGRGVSSLMKGYLTLVEELENDNQLSPNQIDTMRQLLRGMIHRLRKCFPEFDNEMGGVVS